MNQQDPPAGLGYPPPPTQGYPPPGFYGYPPPVPPKKKTGRKIVLWIVMTMVTLFAALCALALIVNAVSGPPASSAPTHRPVPTQTAPQAAPTQVPVIPAPSVPAPTSAPTVPEDTSSSYDSTQFGRPAALSSGLQVQAGIPQSFTPSATAAGNNGVRAFVTEITVRNGSAQPLNPSMISVSASVNGQEATQVYDSAQDIGMPTTNVLPGRSVTYRAVFSSPVEHGAVQVDVSPGFSNGTASFTGSDL